MSLAPEVLRGLSKLKPGELDQLHRLLSEYQRQLLQEGSQAGTLSDLANKLKRIPWEFEAGEDGSGAPGLAKTPIRAPAEAPADGAAATRPTPAAVHLVAPSLEYIIDLFARLMIVDGKEQLKALLAALEALKQQKSRTRRGMALAGMAALLLALGLFFGARAVPPPDADHAPEPGTQAPGVGVPAALRPAADVVTPTCMLEFIRPSNAESIPISGPLNVEWSGIPHAASYALTVVPPPGAGYPWNISTADTSKSLYMENFPAGGKYQLSLTAMDWTGKRLCVAVLDFQKAPLTEPGDREKDDGGTFCNPLFSEVVC